MWFKKIKRNKTQFFLVGMMLVAIAVVFCTCICFTLELKTYANNRFSKEFCPDAYVYSQNNVEPEDNFYEDKVRKNIENISVLKGKSISVPVKYKDINITSVTNMLCTLEDNNFQKYMDIVEGDMESDKPGKGEIWIVKTFATSYGIGIGDKLIVTYEEPVELTVTSICTATFAPSERLTVYANIVNSETLELFEHEPDVGVLAVDLYDTSENSINQLAMSNPYALMTFSREKLRNYITGISGVVGWVSAIAALIVFFAALFIIRFIINNNLRKELRSIGIYKSLGYRSWKIAGFYIKAYMMVGSFAFVIGSISSIPLAYYLGSAVSESLGKYELTETSVLTCVGATCLLVTVFLVGVILPLRKVRSITPVEAILAGQALGEHKLSNSVIRDAKSPFAMAINDIFKHRKTSVITFLVLMVSIYLILFFASSYYTCTNIYEHANVWIACPKFNAIISGSVNEEVTEFIHNNGYADSAILGRVYYYPYVKISHYDGNTRNIEFVVLDEAEEKITGIKMAKGKSPRRAEEIAVSQKLLKQLNKQVGDYLGIRMDGTEKNYLIYGSFVSMEDHAIIMRTDGMKQIDKSYTPINCFVNLKDGVEFEEFKSSVEGNFKGIAIAKEFTALKHAIAAIEGMLTNVMKVMLIVFIVFSVISIVNVLVLTISSRKRQYGILKAMGFTTKYMIEQNLYHILTLFGVGTAIAFVIHIAFSKRIFAMLVINAMIDSVTLSSMLLFCTAFLIIFVTLLISLPIWRITPVDLMEE